MVLTLLQNHFSAWVMNTNAPRQFGEFALKYSYRSVESPAEQVCQNDKCS